AAKLIREAEAACKAGNMAEAKAKAEAAIGILKKNPTLHRRLQGPPLEPSFLFGRGYKMRQMRLGFTGALLLLLPATSTAAEFSVQEALLRAKPAVALVVAEVGSEVLVTCGGRGEKVVRPAPFRETGTGWFVSPG